VRKEKNTKIKNIERYKNFTCCSLLNLARQKNLIHNANRAFHNSYSVVNIEKIKLIYKFLETYASDI
jgi:hypothetical protein